MNPTRIDSGPGTLEINASVEDDANFAALYVSQSAKHALNVQAIFIAGRTLRFDVHSTLRVFRYIVLEP